MTNSEFKFHPNRLGAEFDPNLPSTPDTIIEAGEMSKYVNFIIKGRVYIMNKECAYEFGSITEGSYFGDISILLREPNSFSYVSNDYETTPLQLLRIESNTFMNICDNYPCSREVLTQ